MPSRSETQPFLNRAYSLVTARLSHVMERLLEQSDVEVETLRRAADALGVSDGTTSDEEEREVRHAAWSAVSQECVVAMLQTLLDSSPSETHFSARRLHQLWIERSDIAEFAERIGLNVEDARLALKLTQAVLLTELSSTETPITMDGKTYTIQREGDGLLVLPAKGSSSRSTNHVLEYRGSIPD